MTKHLPEDMRRNQILDAARKCFIEKGYFPTRMEDIAKEARLSKGGIYFHFEGKQQVFEALVQKEYDDTVTFLTQLAQQIGSYQELFEKLASHYLEFFRARPDYPRFFMVMAEMAGRDNSVRDMLASIQKQYTKLLGQILQNGIDAGALKPVDTEAMATLLKGLLNAIEAYSALGVGMEIDRLMSAGMTLITGGLLKNS